MQKAKSFLHGIYFKGGNMHSRILQLEKEFLEPTNFAQETDIPDWFVGSIADYTDLITDKKDKEESFKWLSSYLSSSYRDNRLVITKENCVSYFSYKLNEFEKNLKALNAVKSIDDFISWDCEYQMFCLNNAFDDRHGFWIYSSEDFLTLDRFMRNVFLKILKDDVPELVFYSGSAWDYHI